ncbi:hypothetical protein L484_019075 [Morus notabilis]|uniref:Uncharacterized protein n=1 Tax=Morus notabilis TaxID=981085 RepID=W9SFS1_9ROSA|nr:hypothetical protein L484_019075 [Morus notabilis]
MTKTTCQWQSKRQQNLKTKISLRQTKKGTVNGGQKRHFTVEGTVNWVYLNSTSLILVFISGRIQREMTKNDTPKSKQTKAKPKTQNALAPEEEESSMVKWEKMKDGKSINLLCNEQRQPI